MNYKNKLVRINNNININYKNAYFFSIMIIISLFSSIFLLLKAKDAYDTGYSLLFTLPIAFIVFLISTHNCWREIPINTGLTILYTLIFIRLVISPVLVVNCNFYNVITLNATENNRTGILLLLYETICIAISLTIKNNNKNYKYKNIDNKASNRKMTYIIVIVSFLTVIICLFAPEILNNYRFISGVFTDDKFTNIEQSYIVNLYSTSTFKKLMLVIANYILKVIRIIVPTFLLIQLKTKNYKIKKILSILIIISPFLFVDGAIARSLYLSMFLLLIYNSLYNINIKKMYIPIVLMIVLIIVFFIARYNLSDNKDADIYITEKSIEYFAGVNIVGASCNLPNEVGYRFHYFILDIERSIPFANTIFKLDSSDYIQTFFNRYNIMNGGIIPTTIGMGYYYFSFIFAPIYSVIFARMCRKYGQKAINQNNPYYKLVYYYLSFICALGIGMYNIEITLGTIIQIILPIYIMTRISYGKVDEKNSDT